MRGSDYYRRMTRLIVLAVCAGSVGACAHVQPTQSWPELGRRLGPGKPVAVTDTAGAEVRGIVSSVALESLTLVVGGTSRQYVRSDVRQVRRDGDPLWNGLAIGGAIGVIGAALPDNKCSGQPLRCDDAQIASRVTFAATMTAIGMAVDAMHRDRRVLYASPVGSSLRIVPVLSPERKAISIAVRFSR
jgi:hypothetical protein